MDSPPLLAPLALELKPEEITPDVERDGYQEELGNPAIDEFPDAWARCQQLDTRISSASDGYVAINVYDAELAQAIHRQPWR